MPQTIAIDARPLADPLGEAFPYTLNLVHALAYVDSQTRFQLFVDRDPDPASLPQAANLTVTRLDAPARLWKASALPAAARAVGADLLHVQGLLPSGASMPVVTTLRHLGPLLSPGLYPRATAWSWAALLPRQLRSAAAVIVPWETVARQVRRLPVDPSRLAVIPYGVEPAFSPQCDSVVRYATARVGLTPPYVLGRGTTSEEVTRLLEVWQGARAQGLAASLVLEAEVDGYPTLQGLDPRAWPAILSGARAVILGGQDERAALALLEALACGAPVVGLANPVLAEIAGESAVLGDSAAMAAGLVRLAGDSAERTARLNQGIERAQGYSWPRLAERTLEVYRWATGQLAPAGAGQVHEG